MNNRRKLNLLLLILVVFSFNETVQSQSNSEDLEHARVTSIKADAILKAFVSGPNQISHKSILDRAKAVAVFPNVNKRSLFIYGEIHGEGIVSRRTRRGWSAPAFYEISKTKWGIQFGGSHTDLVVLFLEDGAVDELLRNQFRLNSGFTRDNLIYSLQNGFHAGSSLKDTRISPDDDLTSAAYAGLTPQEVLFGNQEETLSFARKSGIDSLVTTLKTSSPATAEEGRVIALIQSEFPGTSYDVRYLKSTDVVLLEPNRAGRVEDGKIDAQPSLDNWRPSTTDPDPNSVFHVQVLDGGALYHFVCIDRNNQSKEIIPKWDCANDCVVTCHGITTNKPQDQSDKKSQRKRGKSKKRK